MNNIHHRSALIIANNSNMEHPAMITKYPIMNQNTKDKYHKIGSNNCMTNSIYQNSNHNKMIHHSQKRERKL